jgi:hypothetical protein
MRKALLFEKTGIPEFKKFFSISYATFESRAEKTSLQCIKFSTLHSTTIFCLILSGIFSSESQNDIASLYFLSEEFLLAPMTEI